VARPGPRARLFVALDLPEAARASVAAWWATAGAGREDLRPVPAAALHVTLAFLGSRPEEQIPAIAAAALDGLDGLVPPRLAPEVVRGLPPRRPRLFALELRDERGHAAALQARVEAGLVATGLHRREGRPFWAHVTLARVRRPGSQKGERPPGELALPPVLRAPFVARRVTLYRSLLSPRGARYEPLASRELAL
jgi:RNA 2',3'-cyclic 3'-phosphodiesterase